MKKPKVLLIGWDAADWKIISPLLDSGQMPALKRLIENGVMGNIATLDPPLSPMLWTSISTGMTADKHGILGFAEPDPSTGKVRPVSVTSRKVKAVWNILMQKGYKVHTVGWWPGHPAEPLNGVSVSNFFVSGKPKPGEELISPETAVHPPGLREIINSYRVDYSEITGAHLLPFVPNAARIDQAKDIGLQSIAGLLSRGASYHAVATWIMENQEWDFLALYLNELDVFCHTFIKYAPPKQDFISEEVFENYKDVVNSAYRFHDMMLERLMELAGEDATIILLSDHGFHSGEQRKTVLPKDPAAPAFEHAPYGIFCMKGPGIRKDERVYGTTLLDIAPTVLNIFGLPAGEDMPGRVVRGAFENPIVPERIPSWETVEGNSGQHAGDLREDPWAAQEALDQLVELGYLEAPGEDETKHRERITRESKFYLARVFINTDRFPEALSLLRVLHAETPETARYALRLIQCCMRLGHLEEAKNTLEKIRSTHTDPALQANLDFLEGSILLAEHKPRKAIAMLRRAESGGNPNADLYFQVAQAFLRLRNWDDARRAFIHSLSIDSENPKAHHGLALASLRLGDYETAIDEALTAVGQLHFFPAAHYHLGEALMLSGDYTNAVKAFSVSLGQRSGLRKAHFHLAEIFEKHLDDPEQAQKHRDFIREKIRKNVYIVSGLPRSGTSMMMQMLKAGGLDVLTDGKRENDLNNPEGYYEDERAKRMHTDQQWIAEAAGKAVKIVAPLVMHIPQGFDYKIIFMQRDMHEVLTSQQIMLGKAKDVENKTYPAALADAFSKQLEKTKNWLATQPQISVLYLDYAEVVANPEETSENICSFLGLDLDTTAMAASVKKELYRNRQK